MVFPLLQVFQINGRAAGDAGERVFSEAHVQARGVADYGGQPAKLA